MADPTILVTKYLLQDNSLVAILGGENVFGNELPEEFDPTDNPAVTVCAEGGHGHAEVPVATDRIQIRAWAGINQGQLARRVYNEIEKWLNRKNRIELAPDGHIIISQEAVRGQAVTDPDEGYATVLTYYEITSRDSSPDAGIPFSIPHGLDVSPSGVSVISYFDDLELGEPGFDATSLYLSPSAGGMLALVYVFADPGPVSGDFYVPYGLVTIPTVADPTPRLSDWEGTSFDSIPSMPEITAVVLVRP